LPRQHDEWRKAQTLIERNVAVVRALRPPFRCSLLSNADVSLRGRLEGELALHHLFDDIVVSAEVGMAKPTPAIFQLAADRLGLPLAACVFVDDWDANVEAARALGMAAVLHRPDKGDDLRAQLAAVGVTVA
jgi:HAD superfamily hydrolase (TIGR01509 family)